MTGGLWLVWSNEHGAWWAPDRRGYTTVIDAAGRYSQADADQICTKASIGGQLTLRRETAIGMLTVLPEVAVPAPPDRP